MCHHHSYVEVVTDRTWEHVAKWLAALTEVTIISRDRHGLCAGDGHG